MICTMSMATLLTWMANTKKVTFKASAPSSRSRAPQPDGAEYDCSFSL